MVWKALNNGLNLALTSSRACRLELNVVVYKMKIFLLALLVAVASAAPLSLLTTKNAARLGTKEEFGETLKLLNRMLDDYEGVIVPTEIIDLFRSLTIEDYAAMKYLNEISIEAESGDLSTSLLLGRMFKSLHPDFYKRVEDTGRKILKRVQGLSTSTKGQLVNMFLLINHRKKNPVDVAETMIKAYLNWPLDNKKDLDQIFPRMSTTLENMLEMSAEDKEFTYPEDLPNCAVSEDEQPFLCAIFLEAFNTGLEKI
ncbi:hypothetical protein L596_023226 [Steinernema carpocapsae]|uniref:Fatty-acid and retinol-binding protein 1 n=1 Tax=Steinernema carpocapsae TaxID=34508 RepID=A0A4U5MD05_STECR|nr:hypothetical protein L596_023226 [Steinernema carpocapsae]